MIDRINWPQRLGKLPSPFLRGAQERPLGITFHTSALTALPQPEIEALEALTELSCLPEIQALQTEAGAFPHIEIGNFEATADHFPVKVTYRDGSIVETGPLFSPNDLAKIAAKLIHEDDLAHPNTRVMLNDIVIAQAHCALGQDILVTYSPRLLANRNEFCVREANPRKPTEAAKIVGLLLRSRNNYTYRAGGEGRLTSRFDRGLFYWVLVRDKLPGMWRYFSACVESAKIRSDDTLDLGQSILRRCVRAVQARDAIGREFYCPQDNNVRDSIMYHFDYLTLLLTGAIDAEARVTRRVYSISIRERYASFRNPKYLQALEHSAQQLHKLVSAEHSQDVMMLLYTLRNTIHGPGLPPVAYRSGIAEPEESLAAVPKQYQDDLWRAAERCGSAGRWGLIRRPSGRMFLEPYAYSLVLVDECISIIDAVATATDVDMLFPKNSPIPSLLSTPPDDEPFTEQIRKRLGTLA
jgi:hypothetical protein